MKKFFPVCSAVLSGAVTAVIGVVMNAFLIPKIEMNTGGIRCFDMNFGYNYETASEFLRLTGEEGRRIYLGYQLPLDFIYPVAYTLLFISLIVILTKKKSPLIVLPCALALTDYTENILTEIMLRSAALSSSVVSAASAVTAAKTLLMYATILIVVFLIIRAIVKKFRKSEEKKEQ